MIVILPILSLGLQFVFGVLYMLTSIITIFFAAKVIGSDPTDRVVYQVAQAKATGIELDVSQFRALCNICCSYVSPDTKHCGDCNRCVEHFDHHCKWYNNCIGGYNYRLFIASIVSLETNILVLFPFCIYAADGLYQEDGEIMTQLDESYGEENRMAFLLMTSICSATSLIVLLLNTNLILLHAWLRYKGMTTFEYIMKIRKKKADRRRENEKHVTSDDISSGHQGLDQMDQSVDISLDDHSRNSSLDITQSYIQGKVQEDSTLIQSTTAPPSRTDATTQIVTNRLREKRKRGEDS